MYMLLGIGSVKIVAGRASYTIVSSLKHQFDCIFYKALDQIICAKDGKTFKMWFLNNDQNPLSNNLVV